MPKKQAPSGASKAHGKAQNETATEALVRPFPVFNTTVSQAAIQRFPTVYNRRKAERRSAWKEKEEVCPFSDRTAGRWFDRVDKNHPTLYSKGHKEYKAVAISRSREPDDDGKLRAGFHCFSVSRVLLGYSVIKVWRAAHRTFLALLWQSTYRLAFMYYQLLFQPQGIQIDPGDFFSKSMV